MPDTRRIAGARSSRARSPTDVRLEVDVPARVRRTRPGTASSRSRRTSSCTCTRPKIRRHALRLRFTWCMGGITFLLFLILTVTGIILMFYYRPTGEYAYHDMKYLQFDVPFGMIMRNMHRWGAHAMVIAVWLHMFRVFMTGLVQAAARVQLGHRREPPGDDADALASPATCCPWDQLSIWAVTVGTNMGRATPLLGHEGPVRRPARRRRPLRRPRAAHRRPPHRPGDAAALLRAPLHLHPAHRGGADDRALLARPEGRRHLRAAVTISAAASGSQGFEAARVSRWLSEVTTTTTIPEVAAEAKVKERVVEAERLTKLVPDKVHTWPYLVRLEMLVGTIVMALHDGVGDRRRRAARGAGQPDQDAEPLEGALVLPRPAGDPGLLRPLVRGRGAARRSSSSG